MFKTQNRSGPVSCPLEVFVLAVPGLLVPHAAILIEIFFDIAIAPVVRRLIVSFSITIILLVWWRFHSGVWVVTTLLRCCRVKLQGQCFQRIVQGSIHIRREIASCNVQKKVRGLSQSVNARVMVYRVLAREVASEDSLYMCTCATERADFAIIRYTRARAQWRERISRYTIQQYSHSDAVAPLSWRRWKLPSEGNRASIYRERKQWNAMPAIATVAHKLQYSDGRFWECNPCALFSQSI